MDACFEKAEPYYSLAYWVCFIYCIATRHVQGNTDKPFGT